ncbi:MAG: DUF86 domain-containing protein [Anaerolineaceae bacterium]|nr:DUF86 domain-containing protein [Anaerolineaceae bacterium]
MSRDPELYLEDIQTSCEKILHYTVGMAFADFKADDRTYDAVIRNLEIIGEAVKNVPAEFRQNYPRVEWRAIGALRNIVAHEYFGVNDEIVWDIVVNKVPVLRDQVRQILSDRDQHYRSSK